MLVSRRTALFGIAAQAIVMPAIVHSENLMKIFVPKKPKGPGILLGTTWGEVPKLKRNALEAINKRILLNNVNESLDNIMEIVSDYEISNTDEVRKICADHLRRIYANRIEQNLLSIEESTEKNSLIITVN